MKFETLLLIASVYGAAIKSATIIESLPEFQTVIDLDTPRNLTSVIATGKPNSEEKGTVFEISESNLKKMDLDHVFASIHNKLVIKDTRRVVAYNEDNDKWEELETGEAEENELSRYVALSPVLDASQASGSLGQSFSLLVSMGGGLKAHAIWKYYGSLLFNFGTGSGVGVHITTSFKCSVPEGHYGQLLTRPKFWSVEDSRVREVKYRKGQGLVYQTKNWKILDAFKMLSLNMPTIVCRVEPNIFSDTYEQILELDMNELL